MKKIYILLLILPIIFIGCSEDPESPTANYSIEDLVGTWDMSSGYMDMTMSVDIASMLSEMYEEEDCLAMGGTYSSESGCTLSDASVAAMATLACEQLGASFDSESQLSGTTCSITMSEQMCCDGSQSQTLVVLSDGNATLTTIDEYGSEEVASAIISVGGSDLTLEVTDEDVPTYNGSLSISGSTATFNFSISESDFADYDYGYSEMGMSISATILMI